MGVKSGHLVCMAAATWRSYAGLGERLAQRPRAERQGSELEDVRGATLNHAIAGPGGRLVQDLPAPAAARETVYFVPGNCVSARNC